MTTVAAGRYRYDYDHSTALYDDDKLPVEAGLLSLERDAQNGLLLGSSVGAIEEQWQYDEYGDPKLRTVTVNGATIYAEDRGHRRGQVCGPREDIEGVRSAVRAGA